VKQRRGSIARSIPCFVLCLLAAFPAACRQGGQEIPAAGGEPIIIWRTVGTWGGRAGLQTESFISDTGLFRIRWKSEPGGAGASAHLKIVLHSAVSGRSLVRVLEHRGAGAGEGSVTEDPREFFLAIDAEQTAWTVTLDEGVRAMRQPPSSQR
jgi:hypothetical protein